jgi:uncharacterized RDD family membrane protein YckC
MAQDTVPRAKWTRRAGAFALDYMLFALLWGLIDNLVPLPVHESLMSLAAVGIFCLYFGLTEGRRDFRASLGKRLTGLVVVSRDRRQPSRSVIWGRAAVLASILVFDWDDLLSSDSFSTVSFLAFTGLVAVRGSIILYNAFLAVRHPEGLMLQDGLTYTRVVSSSLASAKPAETLPQRPHVEWPRQGIWLPAILVAIGWAAGIFFLGRLGGVEGPVAAARDINKALRYELGIRSRVEIGTNIVYRGAERERNLGVSVWLPAVAWNEATARRTVEIVATHIQVKPGYYDRGSIQVGTGFGFVKLSRSFEINLPKVQDQQQ